jgi:hypothetical protein
MLVSVTETVLGLFTLTCKTGRSVTPGCWMELDGELLPTFTDRVGGFGVSVTVAVNGRVPVGDKVKVGVQVEVDVSKGVLVCVFVGMDSVTVDVAVVTGVDV